MRIREIAIRIGYTLLGALLTLCIVLIKEEYMDKEEVVAMLEELPIETEETSQDSMVAADSYVVKAEVQMLDFEAEAEEMLARYQEEAEIKKQEQQVEEEPEETVSANSIEAAPIKWIKDYPILATGAVLEEKELERSSYEETLAVNAFDKKVIENSTIDFSDIKITILGDSLTTASNLSEEERELYAYPVILQELLGCKEIVNLGIGGSSICSIGDDAMVDRYSDIPKDSDIIIVFGGTNDMLFENKWEYGNLEYNSRMKDETFCGDLDELLGNIEYSYRKHNEDHYCEVICVNPPSNILSDAFYNIDQGNHVHQREFAKAINQVALENEYEVIDFYNNNILNTHDSKVQTEFMPDGIHGNAEGYRIMAEHIASQIIQMIEQ